MISYYLGLTGPLTIENVVLNDINSNFPVAAHQGAIAVTNSERIKFGFQSVNAVTEEMRFGVNPHGSMCLSLLTTSLFNQLQTTRWFFLVRLLT